MLFYDSVGPNPRFVRIFAAERGIELPSTKIDLRGGENRQAAYMTKNPMGQTPALELADGSVLTEITAICEYLDEIAPSGRSLIGANAQERAETRMWTRRIDLNIIEPMLSGFRYAEGLKMFSSRVHCIPQAADDFKAIAQERLAWLDGQIAGREFICGNRLTMADILFYAMVEFGTTVGQPLNPALTHVAALLAKMKARPSSQA